MTPNEIVLLSKIFGDPDPTVVNGRLNSLSRAEKIVVARLNFELAGKTFGSVLESSLKTTFRKIHNDIDSMYFTRIPNINGKLREEPLRWAAQLKGLREIKLFAETSDLDLMFIAENLEEIELKADEPFLSLYEDVKGVYLLKDQANVFLFNSKVPVMTRDGIFGDDACATGEFESTITVRPITNCKAWFVPRDKFTGLLRSVPGLQERIFQEVVERAKQGSTRAEEQRRLTQEILDNIGQGSFSIDVAGEIGENYTVIASEYLGRENLAGVPFADLAFRNDREMLRNYYRALHLLFSGNRFDHSMVVELLPNEVVINRRIFKLHYSFVEDGAGHVMSVFVRMEDKTLERELAAKEKKEKNVIDKMQQNIGGFMDMLDDAGSSFKHVEEFAEEYWVEAKQPDSDIVNQIMRALHGTKGLCGQFELNDMKKAVHKMEDWLLAIEREDIQTHLDEFQELFLNFEKAFQFACSFKENLGEGIVQILTGVSFTQNEFAKMLELIKSGDLEALKPIIISKNKVSAKNIVSNWKKDSERLAEKLGKKINFALEIKEELTISKELAKKLNVGLGHLYRNCVDHGVEKPCKRKEAGKDETGNIKVKIDQNENKLTLVIKDDGAGLDNDAVSKLAKNNSNLDQELVSAHIAAGEYWKILFLPGFSSAATVTDVSGRGVGLDAVQTMINGFNGSIAMFSKSGEGSSFEIEIPLDFM